MSRRFCSRTCAAAQDREDIPTPTLDAKIDAILTGSGAWRDPEARVRQAAAIGAEHVRAAVCDALERAHPGPGNDLLDALVTEIRAALEAP